MAMPDSIDVKLELDVDIDVEIDRNLLRRVVVNIVENAQHAIEESQNTNKDKLLLVGCRLSDSRTEIIVTDSGDGIPDDIYPHIFEPLYSTKGFGVGLGLPIVKQIMEQHGGGVEITSEKNVGTQVVLWLPSVLNYDKRLAS